MKTPDALPFMFSPFFYAKGLRFNALRWPQDKDLILQVLLPTAVPAVVDWVTDTMQPAELAQWLTDNQIEMRPDAVAIWESFLTEPPAQQNA